MKKYLVAVSGGVDSVVLLDMLAKGLVTLPLPSLDFSEEKSARRPLDAGPVDASAPTSHKLEVGAAPRIATHLSQSFEIIVAHFEHGIRGEESLDDQKFVEQLTRRYNLEFVTMNAQLGVSVSEADARAARYEFLRREAEKREAVIVTAHHADDAIETIAINLERGTGWRGLAILDSEIMRPLLAMTKQEILDYAQAHHLEWREDSTNQTDAYLRNRLRRKLTDLDDDNKRQLLALRAAQIELKRLIADETSRLLQSEQVASRYFFTMIDDGVADELLRQICSEITTVAPARPARARMLHAIKTARPRTIHQSTDGFWLTFTQREFQVHHTAERVA